MQGREPVGVRRPTWHGKGRLGSAWLWAASGLGSCARQAPLGIRWVPSDLAVNAASGGMKRAPDGIQRALEKYPRGFRRSELWAENEIQLKKTPAAPPPGSLGASGCLGGALLPADFEELVPGGSVAAPRPT